MECIYRDNGTYISHGNGQKDQKTKKILKWKQYLINTFQCMEKLIKPKKNSNIDQSFL